LSDMAHFLPRCPRCGHSLRMVQGHWWCDFCRAPLTPESVPSISKAIRHAGESIRRFFSPPRRRPSVLIYPPNASSTPERGVSLARCPKCGALTPRNSASCVHCGTPFGQRPDVPAPRVTRVSTVPERDEVVYRYVVERDGEISLSRASTDLHMTASELQAAIRRLENSGKISREGLSGS